VLLIVARIECWLVGSYDSTCHGTSTVLPLHPGSFLLCFPVSSVFRCFPPVFSIYLFFLLVTVFPLFSLFFCLVPLFFFYILCLYLSTLSITYRSYLQTVLHSSFLRSFTSQPILHRISILTTLGQVRAILNTRDSNQC
jgi:hypothetical protein